MPRPAWFAVSAAWLMAFHLVMLTRSRSGHSYLPADTGGGFPFEWIDANENDLHDRFERKRDASRLTQWPFPRHTTHGARDRRPVGVLYLTRFSNSEEYVAHLVYPVDTTIHEGGVRFTCISREHSTRDTLATEMPRPWFARTRVNTAELRPGQYVVCVSSPYDTIFTVLAVRKGRRPR